MMTKEKRLINLEIGGLGVLIETNSSRWKNLVEEKYRPFLAKTRPVAKIILGGMGTGKSKSFWQRGISLSLKRGILLFGDSKTIKGRFELKKMEGELISRLDDFSIFDAFLKLVCAVFFPQFDGFLLHASSLAKEGRAYVFSGETGVGKSTILRLSKQYLALADDTTIIRKIKGKYLVFASPFQERTKIEAGNVKYSLRGVYFLTQGKKNYIERLTPRGANWKLMANFRALLADKDFLHALFPLCAEFAQETPCFSLSFKKDKSFWEIIDGKS